ncbi:MAG: histidine kinase dimerization/phosphoacceptor domain -containing protein [Spirosomataceae bacterium]
MTVKAFFLKVWYLSCWCLIALFSLSVAIAQQPNTGERPSKILSIQLIDFNRNPPYFSVFDQTDNFDSNYLNELEKAFYQAKSDTLRLALINDLAYYWHTRNLDKALLFTQKGLALAAQLHNRRWEGKLQITQGAILLRLEKLDSAYAILQQAKSKVQQQDLPLLITQEGYVMERRGLISQAADYALEALKLGKKLNDLKSMAVAYSDLSNLFWKQSKYSQGINYGLRSEAIFQKRGIKDMDYSFTLYVIGNNYIALKQYDRALAYYQQAIEMCEQYEFYNNLADTYIALIDLHTATQDYTKAENAAQNAIKYSTLLDNNFLLMRSWLSVGKLQNLSKRPQQAIQSLQTCLRVATDNFGDNYFLHQTYKELAKAYAATGNYRQANLAFLKYDALKDSVFTAEADRRVAELQTEFEVGQKEATIQTQEASLTQQRRLQLLTLSLAVLLAVILLGLYWNYRQKKLTNQQLESLNANLEIKNTQLDKRNAENVLLLKEIHHRVKNNLEVVSSLLALQSAQIDDPEVQEAMQTSQNRVQSMGILHQKLYQSEHLAFIKMKNYFKNLIENILDSYNQTNRITIEYPMEEIELDVDTAVPVGLIVNELITNSLKYAFPNKQLGNIRVSLMDLGNDMLQLQIADNGIGKVLNVQAKGTGFGTQLVDLLTRQIEGTLQQEINNGTVISIQFKKVKPA